jgi:hypothetical protein
VKIKQTAAVVCFLFEKHIYRIRRYIGACVVANKIISSVMAVCLLVSMYFLAKTAAEYTMNWQKESEKKVVIIDAGHGKTAGRPKEFERKCSVLSSVSYRGSII